ncbi:MAG: Nif3-like dinuclear metal center hexameric protein [Lachnospiraceae bacterium]|nr:Nif3-like dinuclear metal center hexameric protein [Lachnospiraceae bacterium]
MKSNDVINLLEQLAPKRYACDWDNVGLLVGRRDKEVKKIMIALDASLSVIEQAAANKADMLITHHPMIFSAIKKVDYDDITGKKIAKLIANDITYVAAHTNMDAAVMADIAAKKMELIDARPLDVTYTEKMYKLAVYVPVESADLVRSTMLNDGAGFYGNYSHCSYNIAGKGTYMPLEGTNPYKGTVNKFEVTDEIKIETLVSDSNKNRIIRHMLEVHPYEEVAYDLYEISDSGYDIGVGKIGRIKEPVELIECVNIVKAQFGINNLRLVGDPDKKVRFIAICPGAGKSVVKNAIKMGADVLVTGDIDHHTALDAYEDGLCIIDAGHFCTEHFIVDYLKNHLLRCFYKDDLDNKDIEVISAKEESPFIFL